MNPPEASFSLFSGLRLFAPGCSSGWLSDTNKTVRDPDHQCEVSEMGSLRVKCHYTCVFFSQSIACSLTLMLFDLREINLPLFPPNNVINLVIRSL